MLTIKSDDVFGRAKAYESIIKNEPIVGPKVPESFNVLVKELQGLGLRVDLINTDENEVVDANEAKESRGDSAKAPDEDMEMPPDEIEEFNEDNLPGMQIEDIAVEISAAEEEEE
jgi:DNA-directed RNA polymerase subunit beta